MTSILLLHGVGGRPRSWATVLSLLDPAVRDRTLAVDVTVRSGQSVADVARDVLHRHPGSHVFAGHSFGGMLAQEAALIDRDRVLGLVLVSTIPGATPRVAGINRALADDVERRGIDCFARAFAAGLFAPGRLKRDPELGSAFVADMADAGPTSVCAALRAIAGWDATGRLPTVDCPAVVLTGDAEADVDRQSLLAQLVGARHEIICGTGHLAPLEAPMGVARAIAEMAVDVQAEAELPTVAARGSVRPT